MDKKELIASVLDFQKYCIGIATGGKFDYDVYEKKRNDFIQLDHTIVVEEYGKNIE